MIVDTLFCTCALLCLALRSQVTQLQQQIDQLTRVNASMVQERDGARDEATQATATLAERDAELAAAKDFNGKLSDQLDTCARRSAEKDKVAAALQGHTTELEARLQELETSTTATIDNLTATNLKLQDALREHQIFDAAVEAARKRLLSTRTRAPDGGSSKRQRLDVTIGKHHTYNMFMLHSNITLAALNLQ
jgi:chromosome segregation ATPase